MGGALGDARRGIRMYGGKIGPIVLYRTASPSEPLPNRQPKRYGTAIPLPCLGVSVTVSKVSRAAAAKGTQSCTTHGF